MTSVSTPTIADLPVVDITSDEFRYAPWLTDRRLGGANGLAVSQRGVEVLSYEGAQTMLLDKRLSIGFDEIYAAAGFPDGPIFTSATQSINNLEGAHHAALRGTLARWLTPAKVEELRPWVHELVVELCQEVEGAGRCDFN